MSAAWGAGTHIKERILEIKEISKFRYRIELDSPRLRFCGPFLGSAFNFTYEDIRKPFSHLPYEAFLSQAIFRYEWCRRFPGVCYECPRGQCPSKFSEFEYCIMLSNGEQYVGYSMDWVNHKTGELASPEKQLGLTEYLLIWMCRFKEWEYERETYTRRLTNDYLNKEISDFFRYVYMDHHEIRLKGRPSLTKRLPTTLDFEMEMLRDRLAITDDRYWRQD